MYSYFLDKKRDLFNENVLPVRRRMPLGSLLLKLIIFSPVRKRGACVSVCLFVGISVVENYLGSF